MTEITSLARLPNNQFKINDQVILSELDYKDDGEITYELHWDGDQISESDAVELAESFINSAINHALGKD